MADILCRSCEDYLPMEDMRDWTRHETEKDNEDGVVVLIVTGQCYDCLRKHGPDEHCDPPEEQDEAEARAEIAYRELDKGEL